MSSEKAIRKMRTTSGNVYIIGRMDGQRFVPNYYGKYYKRKSSALRAIKE